VRGEPTCPRCGGELRAPGLWSSDWQCSVHGPVLPLLPAAQPGLDLLEHAAVRSAVPVWAPWPLPVGWLLTGIRCAGDERTGYRATAVGCSGPNPVGGGGELVLVAEDPGVGLGARFAGLPGPDPGAGFDAGPPHAKLHAAGHPTAVWCLDGLADRAVFVGEARGRWLWLVLWPESAGVLLAEDLVLADLRELGAEAELMPFGALSPRLVG